MRGIITSSREAVVHLTVLGADGQEAHMDTVIDTGYTGTLNSAPRHH